MGIDRSDNTMSNKLTNKELWPRAIELCNWRVEYEGLDAEGARPSIDARRTMMLRFLQWHQNAGHDLSLVAPFSRDEVAAIITIYKAHTK
jgi:hypothetical protein